jgi:hypothetical protein
MSNVNFSFGTDLLGDFVAGNGVYVYATVFAGGTWVQTYELVGNGTLSRSLTNLPLPASLVSGDNTNTLPFVRLDVNPVDPTQWRVAGVDFDYNDMVMQLWMR